MNNFQKLYKMLKDKNTLNEGRVKDEYYARQEEPSIGNPSKPSNVIEYEGRKISYRDGKWFVGRKEFSTDKEAYDYIEGLNESIEDDIEEFRESDEYEVAYKDWEDMMKVEGAEPPYEREDFESTTAFEDAYQEWREVQDAYALDGDYEDELDDGIPKKDHIYWDKKHENAFYVTDVYPEQDLVKYWNSEGKKKRSTITKFMESYEPSTNEDDYELFGK